MPELDPGIARAAGDGDRVEAFVQAERVRALFARNAVAQAAVAGNYSSSAPGRRCRTSSSSPSCSAGWPPAPR